MVEDAKRLYDRLAANYHLIFEDWDASIKRQGAALGAILERERGTPSSVRILDCACGIGTQALGLADRGFKVTASDFSSSAVDRARAEAEKRGLPIQVFVADMMDLTAVPQGDFDAVICMDNSLPHLENDERLLQALTQIRRKLQPGKIFMASTRDFDKSIQQKPAVQGLAFYTDHGKRRIVHQVWDWIDDRHYTFHLYITREVSGGGWESQHYVSNYRAVLREELNQILQAAGFINCRWISETKSGFYQPIVLATAK